MSNLVPIDVPDLQPLRESFEYDQFESELKALFVKVFNDTLRESERSLNLTGMPHLGDEELMARALKFDGVAIVMRSAERMEFMLKATRSRNERRGLMYLKKYLQAIWPNVWLVEPLWQPLSSAIYPDDAVSLAKPKDLGSGVTAEYDADGNPSVYRTDWQGKQLLYSTARTNLLKFSEQFDNAVWVKSGGANAVSITTNAVAAPDGTVTADKYVPGSTVSASWMAQMTPGQVAGIPFTTFSFLKNSGGRYANIYFYSTEHGDNWVRFDLQNGVVESNLGAVPRTSSIVSIGNGWYRCSMTFTPTGVTNFQTGIRHSGWGGDGTAGFFMWGADFKAGPLSSYISAASTAVTLTDYTVAANGIATFASGPAPSPLLYFRTGRIRVTLPVTADNGLGLAEIARAFRSTLAARLMLLLQLGIVFENIGANGGLALSNAAIGIMPFTAIGTLQGPSPP